MLNNHEHILSENESTLNQLVKDFGSLKTVDGNEIILSDISSQENQNIFN